MDRQWIPTPQGNWLYAVDSYCRVVADLGSSWSARIEDNDTVYPANVTFLSREDAQAWVKQTLTELLRAAEGQR